MKQRETSSLTLSRDTIRQARAMKGWSQRELARNADLSSSAVNDAENHKKVSLTTAKCICEALELSLIQVCSANGTAESFKTDLVPTILADVQCEERVTVFNETLNACSTIEEVNSLLAKLFEVADIRKAEIDSARTGSIHLDMRFTTKDANRIKQLFPINEHGELIVNEETIGLALGSKEDNRHLAFQATDRSPVRRKSSEVGSTFSKSTTTSSAIAVATPIHSEPVVAFSADPVQEIYRIATELYRQNPDWVTFFREVLGVEGVVRKLFPSADEFANLEQTEEYAEIQQMLASLRDRNLTSGDGKEPTRVITVRLPKSLHESLRAEAHDRKTTMNKLCISKLLQVFDNQFAPNNQSTAQSESQNKAFENEAGIGGLSKIVDVDQKVAGSTESQDV